MKHGAKFYPYGQRSPGMHELPSRFEIHGIPVTLDPRCRSTSESRGLWPLKYIVVGPSFFTLDWREQYAVLWHEVGHCVHFHLEKRLLIAPLFWTKWARDIACRQELEADAYALLRGYAEDLMRVLQRANDDERMFHPSYFVRARALAG